MGITLTKEQRYIVDDIKRTYRKGNQQVYEYGGGAGRGKSVVMACALYELGLPYSDTFPMSYTGAAACVMKTKGIYNARTIHSSLYETVKEKKMINGKPVKNEYFGTDEYEIKFIPREIPNNVKAFLIDEAPMTPKRMKADIESRNKFIIASGDLDQLPPVGDDPAYLTDIDNVKYLHEPMRQAWNSGIFYISERARLGLPIHKGYYGNCIVIDEDDLTDEMLLSSDVILTPRNERREQINNYIRHDLLGFDTDIPMVGEHVICRKNNWLEEVEGINLVNGLMGVVTRQPGVLGYNGKSFSIDFKPNLIQSQFTGLNIDYKYFNAPYRLKKDMKNFRHDGELFEYAYCISVHLSQGSEFSKVIYIEDYFNKNLQRNINYVAASRAKDFLIWVKKKRRYY